MTVKLRQPSDTIRLLILLCFIGGITDTYTYFIRGEVFVNAQTGNLINMSMHIMKGEWRAAAYYLFPLSIFTFGIFSAEILRGHLKEINAKNDKILHWRQIILIVEIIVFTLVAFVPSGKYDVFVNMALSYISALQYQTFKKTNGSVVATTMCTGNLRNGTEWLYQYVMKRKEEDKKKVIVYFGSILYFITGCLICSFVITHIKVREHAILFTLPFAVLAFHYMKNRNNNF